MSTIAEVWSNLRFAGSVPEALMIVCFGVSWPISIAKALRTRKVEGKSPLFMIIVWIGYASGVVHKVVYSRDWVVVLYVLNMALVAIDLFLYRKFLPRNRDGGNT